MVKIITDRRKWKPRKKILEQMPEAFHKHYKSGRLILSSNSPLLAARDEFEFSRIQLYRRVSRADVIPCSLLEGEFIPGD
jgi:hypothetical protein